MTTKVKVLFDPMAVFFVQEDSDEARAFKQTLAANLGQQGFEVELDMVGDGRGLAPFMGWDVTVDSGEGRSTHHRGSIRYLVDHIIRCVVATWKWPA